MFGIIDRFEGKYAVVELPDRTMKDIPRNKIPSQAKEGDVVVLKGDKILVDKEETARRRAEIEKLVEDIWS